MFTAKIKDKEYKIKFNDNKPTEGTINEKPFNLDIVKNNNISYNTLYNNKSYNITIISVSEDTKTVLLKINNKTLNVKISDELDILLKSMGINNKKSNTKKEIKAPMPGLVLKIPVKKGDFVKQGETLLVLEAMKMENNLKSENDVKIKKINVKEGDSVEKNEVLIVFE